MFCINCGIEVDLKQRFCKNCGNPIGNKIANQAKIVNVESGTSETTTPTSIIKCGNCGYEGKGENARNLVFSILAWVCVVFAPLITIIYFVSTSKWRCPKCKSTFLGTKNKEGVFVGQRGGASRVVSAIVLVLVGIAIMGILAAVVLASLNTARQKATGATTESQNDGWISYNSIADGFSVVLPEYPTSDTQTNTSGALPYSYHTYKSTKDKTTFEIAKYVYQNEIDGSDPDKLLERFSNAFVNGVRNGTLVYSSYTDAGQYRTRDFLVSTTDNEDVKGRFVLVGQNLYLIAIDYDPQNYNETDYQKFVSSFIPK